MQLDKIEKLEIEWGGTKPFKFGFDMNNLR